MKNTIGLRILEHANKIPDSTLEIIKKFSTCNLADAMRGFNAMNYLIKPVLEIEDRVVGIALTVRLKPADNLLLHKALSIARPGDVIVVDTGENCSYAVMGEIMAKTALGYGIKGIVVDGLIRDIDEIKYIKLPIFTRGIVSAAGEKCSPGEINTIISCGGVSVSPGDIIVGDNNGVVVVPVKDIDDILKKAAERIKYEEKRLEAIKRGELHNPKYDEILKEMGLEI